MKRRFSLRTIRFDEEDVVEVTSEAGNGLTGLIFVLFDVVVSFNAAVICVVAKLSFGSSVARLYIGGV